MCEKHKVFFKKKLTDWKVEIVKTNNEALYNGSLDDNSASADIVDQASSYTDKKLWILLFKISLENFHTIKKDTITNI